MRRHLWLIPAVLLLSLTLPWSRPKPNFPPQPVPGPEQGPWPPALTLSNTPDGGIKLTDTAGVKQAPVLRELVWLNQDQLHVTWGVTRTAHFQVDLKAQSVAPTPAEQAFRSISPDGRFAVIRRSRPFGPVTYPTETGPSMVVDAATGERVRMIAPAAHSEWFTPNLLFVDGGHLAAAKGLYDVAAKRRIPLLEAMVDVTLLNDALVCYGSVDRVGCTRLSSGDWFWLTPEKIHGQVASYVSRPAMHVQTQQVAFQYPSATLFSSTVAGIEPRRAKHAWSDRLGIYDAVAGTTDVYDLPGSFIPYQMIWSPDGADVWLHHRPLRRIGPWMSPGTESVVHRVDLATGHMEQVLDGAYELVRAENGGAIIYTTGARDEPMIKRPGQEPVRWQPDKRYVHGPTAFSDLPPGAVAFVTDAALEILFADGSTRTWPWSSDETPRGVALSPDGEQLAVLLADPFRLVFLKR